MDFGETTETASGAGGVSFGAMPLDLSNQDLKRAQVPAQGAPWAAIAPFALTFDGYKRFGNALGDLANKHSTARTVPADLAEARACLFFEQRRWRHFGETPDEASMKHIHALVECIREGLARVVAEP